MLLSPESCTSSPKDELYGVTFQVSTSRADFESKYRELHKLGSGGFGSVFAGERLDDACNVAIKHIPWEKVQNGVEHQLINEVAIMVKVSQGNCPAVVSLLDCYELPEEVILVMERPVPSMDLHDYKEFHGGVLEEEEAKVILRQMVEASIQMHNSNVFHRDLKLKNILVETDHSYPKVRVIDFGCGCLVKEVIKCKKYTPPEWHSSKGYSAEPTTVFHLGVITFTYYNINMSCVECFEMKNWVYIYFLNFSLFCVPECRHFLKSCLAENPDDRPSLEELLRHPCVQVSALIKTAAITSSNKVLHCCHSNIFCVKLWF
uniref:Serine/threonine-protein kinase n=1 Tax=Periophthalmus magnuspinnatus TaxID=409849 RepID=A0A3B4A8W0_9GOBI